MLHKYFKHAINGLFLITLVMQLRHRLFYIYFLLDALRFLLITFFDNKLRVVYEVVY